MFRNGHTPPSPLRGFGSTREIHFSNKSSCDMDEVFAKRLVYIAPVTCCVRSVAGSLGRGVYPKRTRKMMGG